MFIIIPAVITAASRHDKTIVSAFLLLLFFSAEIFCGGVGGTEGYLGGADCG